VHAGHIAFALQAAKYAKLDRVYLMPERRPRHKPHVTHYAHRIAMVRQAVRPHAKLEVLESEDRMFSVTRTLPRLQKHFPGATLVFVCGSDVVRHMGSWPRADQLLTQVELCVGLRRRDTKAMVEDAINRLPHPPMAHMVIESHAAGVNSSDIRSALRGHGSAHGLLKSVVQYARQEWLYV